MKGKFEVGDRVIVNGTYDGLEINNQKGRVLYYKPSEEILIEFEESFSSLLHGGAGRGKMDFCWWIMPGYKGVEIALERETIVIYRKGNDVIALDNANDKKAVARCNPEDTFDFETGARLAFERLFEKEALLNTKIVFGNGDSVFKPGRIYEIIGGKIISPYGANEEYPIGETRFHSIEEVKEYFAGGDDRKLKNPYYSHWSNTTFNFIEIKED